MASSPSLLNEDKKNNRYDPSKMYNIGQTPLARLRPEKLDDVAIKTQISIIQQTCGEIDPDIIALVFHECDYNIQKTISRIKSSDFEDGGWQTAKSNNKKKNNNLPEQILNGGAQSDSERSPSQRSSPISSLRGGGGVGGRLRQDHYQYSSSSRRRGGNDSGRNHFIPRYQTRNYPNNNNNNNNMKSAITPIQQNPSETILSSKQQEEQSNEEITPTTSSSTDEYEFIGGTKQSLTFDNSLKKTPIIQTSKRPIPSSIPQEPVSMHPTVQFSTQPIDIQFGDVQWNDSVPITVSPPNHFATVESLNDQEISPIATTHGHEQHSDVQDNLSPNYNNHQSTNEIDMQLLETTNRLSSSSISSLLPTTNNNILNNLSAVPLEGTSHLSDHLTNSSQQQAPLQMTSSSSSLTDTVRLPPTSTPRAPDYTSPTSQTNNSFTPNNFQPSLSNTNNGASGNVSAFTPYSTPGTYQPIPRDYSQTASSWNQQSSNYKSASKPTMVQTGNYPQQSAYQLPPQQQFIVGHYPYHTPTLYQVITPVDSWSTAGYPSSLEPYSTYPTTNYLPTYPTQAQYHPTNQYSYDKEFFAHYGQTRSSNNDLSNSSQQIKDAPLASKLSATAATFPHAANPVPAFYFNSVPYTVPTYYTSHQDRTMSYPSVDSRDNRNGASYGGNNNRNHYHQQQRTHNNSTWHSQQ